MFDQIDGMPLHALALHFPIVLAPFLAFIACLYVLVAKWRHKLDLALGALAVLTGVSIIITGLSGLAFRNRLSDSGMNEQVMEGIDRHGSLGLTFSIVGGILCLLVLTLLFMEYLERNQERYVSTIFVTSVKFLTVIMAVLTVVFALLAGDAGARLVWGS